MTPRDRVLNTLAHQPVDRVPRDCWPLPCVRLFRGGELAALRQQFPMDIRHGITAPGEVAPELERLRGLASTPTNGAASGRLPSPA